MPHSYSAPDKHQSDRDRCFSACYIAAALPTSTDAIEIAPQLLSPMPALTPQSNTDWLLAVGSSRSYTYKLPHVSLLRSARGESARSGCVLPCSDMLAVSCATNASTFLGVTFGMTTTCAMSSSHASCHFCTNGSWMGLSSTTVELRSFNRHVTPARVS
mmetsp:Transcript_47245/g.94118  ORF Transcript_47245/g.94118 Transcript_47245/m.94118 type:complete len:159 (+) Transcript_47245:244-720(+)